MVNVKSVTASRKKKIAVRPNQLRSRHNGQPKYLRAGYPSQ
jgi:hypothetical protein